MLHAKSLSIDDSLESRNKLFCCIQSQTPLIRTLCLLDQVFAKTGLTVNASFTSVDAKKIKIIIG